MNQDRPPPKNVLALIANATKILAARQAKRTAQRATLAARIEAARKKRKL